MSWTPPERPDWVCAVNAGDVAPIAEEAALPLTRESLVGEAAARQGRVFATRAACDEAFGHPDFPSGPAFDRLDRFLEALANEARLNVLGRWMTRRFLLRVLEVRLQLMDTVRADPGVQEERIQAPLFVAGAPRTGTTILFALLAADPRHRVPEAWELLRPVPPPSPDPERFARDPRIALADRELVRPQTVVSGLLQAHEYGGRKPKECLSAQTFAFQSEELTARFHVPTFERFLEAEDMRDAYRMHRLVLQVLQRGHGPTDWVLKSPVHLHALPTLFETYPDARVAVTHRDPLTLLASLTSLIANLRWAHSDHVDPGSIAASHLRRYEQTFERLVDWTAQGTLPADRVHHSHFRDFLHAPIETARGLYASFDRPFTEGTATALQSALDANPREKHGTHSYTQDDLGAPPATLRPRFARYQQAFQVPND